MVPAQLEAQAGSPLYMATGDIECAFYRLLMPSGLSAFFRLPAVAAGLLSNVVFGVERGRERGGRG